MSGLRATWTGPAPEPDITLQARMSFRCMVWTLVWCVEVAMLLMMASAPELIYVRLVALRSDHRNNRCCCTHSLLDVICRFENIDRLDTHWWLGHNRVWHPCFAFRSDINLQKYKLHIHTLLTVFNTTSNVEYHQKLMYVDRPGKRSKLGHPERAWVGMYLFISRTQLSILIHHAS